MKPAFSLKWLFVVTTVAAVGIAAVNYADEWWGYAASTVSALAFAAAVISAAYYRWTAPFSIGYAITVICLVLWANSTPSIAGDGGWHDYGRQVADEFARMFWGTIGGLFACYLAARDKSKDGTE